MSDTRPLTARELIARGIEQDQFDRPFAGGKSPEERQAAAETEENRRRNHDRAALGYRALYERGMRALEEEAAEAGAQTSARPPMGTTGRPLNPTSAEAVAANEATMDRRLAQLWPGGGH